MWISERLTPEEKARREIDRQLDQCGWLVQDRIEIKADYLLYAGGKVIGVVEAKPQGHTLAGDESQSVKYAGALPPGVLAHRLPLPFCYKSTEVVTQFTNPGRR